MPKKPTRSDRWNEAVGEARQAFNDAQSAADALAEKLSDLKDIQSEFEDWRDNLPENLQGSALGEKLETVCELDIEGVMNDPLENWGDVETVLDEAEAAELPLGFGRD